MRTFKPRVLASAMPQTLSELEKKPLNGMRCADFVIACPGGRAWMYVTNDHGSRL